MGPDGRWRPELERLAWEDSAAAAAPPPARLTAPLCINTAPAESLVLLPRVGPVLAGRIIAAREGGAVFHGPADLVRVKGIGPRMAALLDSLLDYRSGPPVAAAIPVKVPALATEDTIER